MLSFSRRISDQGGGMPKKLQQDWPTSLAQGMSDVVLLAPQPVRVTWQVEWADAFSNGGGGCLRNSSDVRLACFDLCSGFGERGIRRAQKRFQSFQTEHSHFSQISEDVPKRKQVLGTCQPERLDFCAILLKEKKDKPPQVLRTSFVLLQEKRP